MEQDVMPVVFRFAEADDIMEAEQTISRYRDALFHHRRKSGMATEPMEFAEQDMITKIEGARADDYVYIYQRRECEGEDGKPDIDDVYVMIPVAQFSQMITAMHKAYFDCVSA